jgi:hypothetical protein
MKKLLLTMGLALLGAHSFAQVIVYAEEPAIIEGNFEFNHPTNWSGQLSVPANAVLDTVVLADDSLACTPITNDLTGKIALVYRGGCEFSAKALAAQNAGARAVIIVNNIPGPPVGMGIGASGASVTIPAVMISQDAGAQIRAAMLTDDVVMYLGVKNGYFMDDLGFTVADALRADANGIPSQIAQNAGEFTTTLGTWVHNYGQNDQTGVTVTATVNNGTEVYNETSAADDVPSGDSIWFEVSPAFSLPSYPAETYTITYTINYGTADDYTADNTLSNDFKIQDSIYSLARLDAQGLPISTIGTRPATNNLSYSSCIVFSNPNASRLGATGLYFTAAINAPDSLWGQEIIVTAYRWEDAFVDLNDPNFGFTSLTEMTTTSYYFEDVDNYTVVYAPFPEPFVMDDDQRYMFCAQTFNTEVFLGYDEESRYLENIEQDLQPVYPIENDGDWLAGGFVSNAVPSLAVRMVDADLIGISENTIETSTFPNPAKDLVTVKVDASGTAVLNVTDLAGRTVLSQEVSIVNGQFTTNVSGFNAGTYVFNLSYDNGASSQVKVVVTK